MGLKMAENPTKNRERAINAHRKQASQPVYSKFGLSFPEFVRGGGRWASAGKSQYRSQNALVVVRGRAGKSTHRWWVL
jgi:hypothetical protein